MRRIDTSVTVKPWCQATTAWPASCQAVCLSVGPAVIVDRVLALLFWRRVAVLNLAARDIDHEFGELGRVARAFQRFVGHSDLLNFLPRNSTANNKAMIAAARRAGVRIS